MPRLVTNNPTERILRLLDDFEQMETAYNEVLTKVAHTSMELFNSLPPKPFCEAIIEERLRQQLTSGRTRAKRQVMQRLRANPESRSRREHTRPNAWSKGGQPELERAFDTILPASLSPEQLADLAREMNQESIQPEDLADLQLETKKP